MGCSDGVLWEMGVRVYVYGEGGVDTVGVLMHGMSAEILLELDGRWWMICYVRSCEWCCFLHFDWLL